MTDIQRLLSFEIPNLLSIFHFYFVPKFDILCDFSEYTVTTVRICCLSLNFNSRTPLLVVCSRLCSQYASFLAVVSSTRNLRPHYVVMARTHLTWYSTFFKIKWLYILPTECKSKYNLRTKCGFVWFLRWYVVTLSSASGLPP
jgi:hypothetical protein